MTLHCGRGHQAFGLRASSGARIREAMAGSTDGMRPSPTCAAFCMAAKVRASDVELDRALVSLQQAWSSFKYSSEEGTENVAGTGLRLKKALAWADSVCAASSCRRARAVRRTAAMEVSAAPCREPEAASLEV